MKYGIIGAGNMGSAVARVLANGDNSVLVCDHHPEKLQVLKAEVGAIIASADDIAATCDAIVLAIKPQVFPAALAQMAPVVQTRCAQGEAPVVITMAAGITIKTVQDALGVAVPVIRIMPNTPLIIGEGMVGYSTASFDGEPQDGRANQVLTGFCQALEGAGKVVEVDEQEMDAVVAVSGSGPAFVYAFIDALIQGGIRCGLDEQTARVLAAQTVLGAAAMVQQSSEDPGTLAQRVCSPGGTTIEGMKALQAGDFAAIVQEAVLATRDRSVELSKQ